MDVAVFSFCVKEMFVMYIYVWLCIREDVKEQICLNIQVPFDDFLFDIVECVGSSGSSFVCNWEKWLNIYFILSLEIYFMLALVTVIIVFPHISFLGQTRSFGFAGTKDKRSISTQRVINSFSPFFLLLLYLVCFINHLLQPQFCIPPFIFKFLKVALGKIDWGSLLV